MHLYICSETNRLPKHCYPRTLNLLNKMILKCMMRFKIQKNKQYVSTQKWRLFHAQNIQFFNKIVFIYKTLFFRVCMIDVTYIKSFKVHLHNGVLIETSSHKASSLYYRSPIQKLSIRFPNPAIYALHDRLKFTDPLILRCRTYYCF